MVTASFRWDRPTCYHLGQWGKMKQPLSNEIDPNYQFMQAINYLKYMD
jgi:hypothetical protein